MVYSRECFFIKRVYHSTYDIRLHDDDRQAMQNSIKSAPMAGAISILPKDVLNSTGNTPVTSPVHPAFVTDYGTKHHPGNFFIPPYRYNRGYLV